MSLLDEYQFGQLESYTRECEDAEREDEIEREREEENDEEEEN